MEGAKLEVGSHFGKWDSSSMPISEGGLGAGNLKARDTASLQNVVSGL